MAVKELIEMVGRKNVLEDGTTLEAYCRDMSFTTKIRPKCIVKIGNAGELEKLVKWANATGTPLVPVSSGAPHFRGDTIPSVGGAIIVDMSGMNKIVSVDGRNRVAMIEPGVNFSQLIPELTKAGLRLNMPLLPRSSKSVIGSMLEREPVIMPGYQWDAQDPLNCVEVIFGTGEVFKTGSAAGPASLEKQKETKQAQVSAQGPGQTDFARVLQGAQGTMGIVTWATLRCELLPAIQKPFVSGSAKLEKLSDFIYRLLWLKAADENLVLNNVSLAAILAKSPEEYINLKNILPSWVHFFCLAGYEYFPEDRLGYHEEEMIEAAQQYGIKPSSGLKGVSAFELLKTSAKPSDDPYWKLRNKGGCQDIMFISTLERIPKFVEIIYEIAEQYGYPTSEIGVYVQPMIQGTSCHCEFNLFYDPENEKELAQLAALYASAGEALIDAGAFFSRPYGALAEMAFGRDAETTAALRKVKKIMDPKDIMNTGKLCF
ncbi:MAG: hypothetical protein A2Z02_02435 [Chloroflexi bacterium RBG_16_48_7]|nr:MAG: hypothetical protein A2Z02_02435 [Chloroflexi bacterium RBG_16_48_7]